MGLRRLLLTGASGQLGRDLKRLLLGRFEIVAPTRSELDLLQPALLRYAVRSIQPSIIVNAAAWTDVEGAEAFPEQAMAVNGIAPGVLAAEARRCGATLLHYSTDYVFAGDKQGSYTEADTPAPLNNYGMSKYAGEQAVAAVGGRYLILRTSWLYSAHGRNFLNTVLRLSARGGPLRFVDDQFGNPTWTRDLAQTSASLLVQMESVASQKEWWRTHAGIYQVAGSGGVNWHQFASRILMLTGRQGITVQAVSSAEYGATVCRPTDSRLDCSHFSKCFNLPPLPVWDASLRICCREMETVPYSRS